MPLNCQIRRITAKLKVQQTINFLVVVNGGILRKKMSNTWIFKDGEPTELKEMRNVKTRKNSSFYDKKWQNTDTKSDKIVQMTVLR